MPANKDNYDTLDSGVPTPTDITSDMLIPPYVTDTFGPVRVMGADLVCEQRPNGMYHYSYRLRVIPEQETPSLVALAATRASSRSRKASNKETSVSVVKETPKPAPKMRVSLTILTKNRRNKVMSVTTKDKFERSMFLHEVLHAFRESFGPRFNKDYQPCVSMVAGGNKRPIGLEDIHLRLDQLCPADVTKIDLIAEN